MKVIFDTDPGIDDTMALLYLQASKELELLGITTILGNANIDDCTNNALYLCEQFSIDTSVYRGADRAVNGSVPDEYPDFVHGVNGLGDIELPVVNKTVEPETATSYLIKEVTNQPHEVTIIAVGRLTNLALAIQENEVFADSVKNIVIMGGAIRCEGNVTPYAEANIIGDPEAAQIVFESGIPLTLVGLDVTMKTNMTMPFVRSLIQDVPAAAVLEPMNQYYANYHVESHRTDVFPVHDSSAIACAIDPTMFGTELGNLECVLEGTERGRTKFQPDSDGHHLVCTTVDSSRLLDHYQQLVRQYLLTLKDD